MKIHLRDFFWAVLVAAILLSKYVNRAEYLECPCCGSTYDVETVRSVSDPLNRLWPKTDPC